MGTVRRTVMPPVHRVPAARSRRSQCARVLWIGEEGEIAGTRVFNAGDTMDLDLAVPLETALQSPGNVPQLQRSKYMLLLRLP